MENVKIIVVGPSGSGKSSVAELLNQLLTEAGFDVTLTDDNGYGVVDESPGTISHQLIQRLTTILNRNPEIEIQTKSVNRIPFNDYSPRLGARWN